MAEEKAVLPLLLESCGVERRKIVLCGHHKSGSHLKFINHT